MATDDIGGQRDDDARRARLRATGLACSAGELRDALASMSEPMRSSLAAGCRVPPPVLRRSSDPARFLARLDESHPGWDLVAGAVSGDCLEETVEVLGEAADDPTPAQLREAVDAVLARFSPTVVRVMLASVAADEDAPARDACHELLAELGPARPAEEAADSDDADAGEAAIDDVDATPGLSPEEKREARRARRQQEAERRRRAASRPVTKRARRRDPENAAAGADEPSPGAAGDSTAAGPVRRVPRLPAPLARGFTTDDPLVGAVVTAEVPFDAADPASPEQRSKRRPVVVVAVAPDHLLVRAGYSEGGARSRDVRSVQLKDWRAAGLDGPSWIEAEVRKVARSTASEPLGRLSLDDWNHLW